MLEADPTLTDEEILEKVLAAADALYQSKIDIVGKESFGGFERNVMLQSVDSHWREHLAALDHLRQGIHLRGYAQKNPSRNTSAKRSNCSARCWT
jgi:preprotein translocase subunit SecA